MTTDYLKLMTDMTHSAYETSQQWAEINNHTLNALAQQQMTMFESGIEKGFGMARKAMQVKDYNELTVLQTEMAKETAAMAAEQTRKITQVLRVSREALAGLFKKSVERAASEFNIGDVKKAA